MKFNIDGRFQDFATLLASRAGVPAHGFVVDAD